MFLLQANVLLDKNRDCKVGRLVCTSFVSWVCMCVCVCVCVCVRVWVNQACVFVRTNVRFCSYRQTPFGQCRLLLLEDSECFDCAIYFGWVRVRARGYGMGLGCAINFGWVMSGYGRGWGLGSGLWYAWLGRGLSPQYFIHTTHTHPPTHSHANPCPSPSHPLSNIS